MISADFSVNSEPICKGDRDPQRQVNIVSCCHQRPTHETVGRVRQGETALVTE